MKKELKSCPKCGLKTDLQFCKCGFNIGKHYSKYKLTVFVNEFGKKNSY